MSDSPDLFGSGNDERDPGGESPSLSDAEMPDSQRRQSMVSGEGAGPAGDVIEDDSDQRDQPHPVLTNQTMKRKFRYWGLTLSSLNLNAVFRADNSLFSKQSFQSVSLQFIMWAYARLCLKLSQSLRIDSNIMKQFVWLSQNKVLKEKVILLQ